MTVNAGGDADRTDDAAMLTHGASGGGYGGVSIASVRGDGARYDAGAADRRGEPDQRGGPAACRGGGGGAHAWRGGGAHRRGGLRFGRDRRCVWALFRRWRTSPSCRSIRRARARRLPRFLTARPSRWRRWGRGASGDGTNRAAALWGGGERLSLSGSQDGVIFDGTLWSAQLGADVRLRPDLLAGLALSRTQGNVDAHTADGRVRRAHETVINAISPYAAWLLPDGSVLWASAGYGRGQVRVTGGRFARAARRPCPVERRGRRPACAFRGAGALRGRHGAAGGQGRGHGVAAAQRDRWQRRR